MPLDSLFAKPRCCFFGGKNPVYKPENRVFEQKKAFFGAKVPYINALHIAEDAL